MRTIASTLWFDWKTLMSDALSVQSGMAGGPTGGTACDLSPVSFVAKRDTVVNRISIWRRSLENFADFKASRLLRLLGVFFLKYVNSLPTLPYRTATSGRFGTSTFCLNGRYWVQTHLHPTKDTGSLSASRQVLAS